MTNLGDGFRQVISFIMFGVGILAAALGTFLIIKSFVDGSPYLFEGGTAGLLGLILVYITDVSMTARKQYQENKDLIKQINLLSKRQSAGQGGGGMFGMMNRLFGGTDGLNITSFKIMDTDGNVLDESGSTVHYEDVNHPNVQNEVKNLMARTNLEEEDAITAVFLKDKSISSLEKALKEAEGSDKFELARFIHQLIEEKKNQK